MLPPTLTVSSRAARCFHRAALRFDAPHPDVAAALDYQGYVQIDPVNVCGRMHDLILRHRVAGYREHDLLRHLYGDAFETAAPRPAAERCAFEHYLPGLGVLAALPLAAWPYLGANMERRATHPGGTWGRLSPGEERVAAHVLAEIAVRGPLAADDIAHEGRATTAWGTRGRLVKAVLDKLFVHGRVLLATRRGFRRIFDLPARVVPASVLAAPRPTAAETQRWLVHLRLRQRRLVILKQSEWSLVEDLVQPLRVEGCPPLVCLREDLPRLVAAAESSPPAPPPPARAAPRLLAPLDPLIYDRRLTAALWNFQYTWEAYTPPAKRVRGHYALPILADVELSGYVDPKADRARQRLVVISRRVRRGLAVQPAVRELAQFLGLKSG